MRAFRFLNLAILSILVASSAVLYAQDEKPQEDKPARQEEPKRQEDAKPASRQDEMKPPKQQDAKPAQQDKQDKEGQKRDEKQPREQMNREQMNNGQMNNGRQETAPQQEGHARPAGKGARIPDEKFHAQFGRDHVFKVQRPVAVQGGQGFVYGGYSFVIVDAWPPDWAYTDDCYVDYIDGEYFLFDMLHPGVRIALMVVM
jgi:hypothetical protein